MPKDGFTRNPYPDLNVTEQQREQLIELVNGCVQNHFQKYEQFFVTDHHHVDERRWEHVKSKDDLHVYNERSQKDQARRGLISTSPIQLSEHEKDMAVMMSSPSSFVQSFFNVIRHCVDVQFTMHYGFINRISRPHSYIHSSRRLAGNATASTTTSSCALQ
ncbi:hypothetical protein PC117_g25239 [Phytophthora cactorum]|uniref:Uncharacterized protein n=1 Tax=Phytophthora cactorum TaxID=29920 RepID=A0A8T1AU39_9STRA|nr:hypothetical protein PC117_g25239 [Phytophthora cactorum]